MDKSMLSIIVAVSKNNVIGLKGKMPWYIKEDLERFREITLNHKLIMGRRTFEYFEKPLDLRENIILTRNLNYNVSNEFKNVSVIHSLEEVKEYINSSEEVFVIGGEEIYRLLMPYTNKVYLTLINEDYEGDTYFNLNEVKKFNLIESDKRVKDNKLLYEFLTYERKEQ